MLNVNPFGPDPEGSEHFVNGYVPRQPIEHLEKKKQINKIRQETIILFRNLRIYIYIPPQNKNTTISRTPFKYRCKLIQFDDLNKFHNLSGVILPDAVAHSSRFII